MSIGRSFPDLSLRSPVFPGGSLISAIFDRDLVRLSDRGGASGLIGDRWSDMSAEAMAEWPGTTVQVFDTEVHVDRIVRLDAIPAIARTASRKKLQNPDYIIVGRSAAGQLGFSADAKFSIETAGASQVSGESLRALLELGPILTETLGVVDADMAIPDGIFLSPDYSLTHYMLGRKRGYRSVSVDAAHITLLPVTAVGFFKPLEASTLIPIYADADGYGPESRRSLLAAQYYFRLVRAGIGCWNDENGPLLVPRQKPELDLAAVDARARDLAQTATSGWEIIQQWDAQAESVRTQREAVNQVSTPVIVNRELRVQLETAAKRAGVTELPSMSKVRRRIGSWFHEQLVEDFGPIMPPVANLPALLQQLGARSQELRPELERMTRQIIEESLREVVENPGSGMPVALPD